MEAAKSLVTEPIFKPHGSQGSVNPDSQAVAVATARFSPHTGRVSQNRLATIKV